MAKKAPPKKMGTFTKLIYVSGFIGIFFAVNWVYHVSRKPTELLTLFGHKFSNTPKETWSAYEDDFREHSTNIVSPTLLAALAQSESQGNALARTYWRWKLSLNPFEIYSPASSAVGMFQITSGTANQVKPYGSYLRIFPGHAIQMTASHLHKQSAELLARSKKQPSSEQKQTLATIIHLCGPGRGEKYVRRGFEISAGERCGDHSLLSYVTKVKRLKSQFEELSKREY